MSAGLLVPADWPMAADTLDAVTVEAQREREQLKRDVDHFIAAAIIRPSLSSNESLSRWNDKICPLVAGLGRAAGEFMLARLSTIAHTAGAPLGSETCKPNFYVILAPDPELLLRTWWQRNPDLFGGESGADVQRYLVTPRPIRVWYNAGTVGADGNFVLGMLDSTSVRAHAFNNEPIVNVRPSSLGSKLTLSATRNILSVIVIIDSTKVRELNMGQLSDYVGLVGLAQINLGSNLDTAPTLLNIFSASEGSHPAEMTAWDKALLHALYNTPQTDRMQRSEMQTVALRDIAANSAK